MCGMRRVQVLRQAAVDKFGEQSCVRLVARGEVCAGPGSSRLLLPLLIPVAVLTPKRSCAVKQPSCYPRVRSETLNPKP